MVQYITYINGSACRPIDLIYKAMGYKEELKKTITQFFVIYMDVDHGLIYITIHASSYQNFHFRQLIDMLGN